MIHVITTIRRSGNSFVIRVPREEMERVGVGVDEYVSVEIRPIEIRPGLAADLREAVDAEVPLSSEAFRLLAEN
jgi:antitoxin component of MazEF toxin-antitoxin module